MRKSIAILASCAALGLAAATSATWAQAKTAKACREEWRADKVNFQAKGISEKAYGFDSVPLPGNHQAVTIAPLFRFGHIASPRRLFI